MLPEVVILLYSLEILEETLLSTVKIPMDKKTRKVNPTTEALFLLSERKTFLIRFHIGG
jgi:hypothetical protein